MSFPMYSGPIPSIDTHQMIEVDRAMIEDYEISLIQMMENAGSCLANVARKRFFDGDPHGKTVTVLAGTGGNGGGALVAARRLLNYGAKVEVFVTRPSDAFSPISRHQYGILVNMKQAPRLAEAIRHAQQPDLILDGVIGYSLQGAPRGSAADLINWANNSGAPILALDAPSGIDTTTGQTFDPSINATATLTLALPKKGLLASLIASQVGELYLADISVPPELYALPELSIEVGHIFAKSDIIRLR